MLRTVSKVDHRPTARVLDFCGFNRAQQAFSYWCVASSVMGKSATEDRKIVTSSAYATTDTGRHAVLFGCQAGVVLAS